MRYPFQCTACGLVFDVSRRMDEAGGPAMCPEDGARAARIFTVPQTIFGRREPAAKPRPGAPKPKGFSHHGHSHGPGTSHHSHGPAPSRSAGPQPSDVPPAD
jgi:putative FmdB family regulatory protein